MVLSPSVSATTLNLLPHFDSGDINRLDVKSEGKRLPPIQQVKGIIEGV